VMEKVFMTRQLAWNEANRRGYSELKARAFVWGALLATGQAGPREHAETCEPYAEAGAVWAGENQS
jgi:hypothetical protein